MEEFELKPLNSKKLEKDDVENYYEISNRESLSFGERNVVSEFDFFTKTHSKSGKKSKNKKKKDRVPINESLMDMVNAEIAGSEAPIQKNVITQMEFPKGAQRSYLVRKPLLSRARQWKPDMEWGIATISPKPDFSPVFPKILENAFGHKYDMAVQYVKPVKFIDFMEGNTMRIKGNTDTLLCIKIKNLHFSSHHSFCLEELLVSKVVDIYDEYQVLQNRIQSVTKELMIKREAKENLKQQLLKISNNKENALRDPTMIKYAEKYFELKDLVEQLSIKENEVFNHIVSLWSDVETIRRKMGSKTTYELQLTEQRLDHDEYEKKWSQLFNIELYDMLEKIELEYNSKYAEYKANKHKSEKGSLNVRKPKVTIDEDELKRKAEENVKRILRKKYITVKLTKDKKILNKDVLKNEFKYKCSLKIYVDESLVCETEKYCLNDIKVDFSENFLVQIIKENVSLIIVLCENMEEKCIHKINIGNLNKTKSGNHITVDFIYNDIIEPNARTVGSGYSIKEIAASCKVRLKSSNFFSKKLYTQCRSNITIGWSQNNESNHGKIKLFYEVQNMLKRLLTGSEMATFDSLKYLIETVYDADISNNQQVINSLKAMCNMTINKDITLEINENSEDLIRIHLLHLRAKGEFGHMTDKLIPLYSSQITTEQLNCLQMSKDDETNLTRINFDKDNTDPIELQRYVSAKYMDKLNRNLAKALHESLLKKNYSDIVAEFGNYTLRKFISMDSSRLGFADINGYRKQSLDEFTSKEQVLFVNVMRAFNLPDRTPCILTEDNVQEIGDSIAGFRVRSLRPFVKVQYQEETAQTGIGIGCHPTWNQTLQIKIKPGKLSIIDINVFDEEKINITENDEDSPYQSGTFHFTTHNKWLGSVQIPLYSVFSLGKVKGAYKINVPFALLGYETQPKSSEAQDSFIPGVSQMLKKETAYLYLQISTNISHLGAERTAVPIANSDDYILKHLNNFINEYKQTFPLRSLSLTFIDRAGRHKCVTQFIQPIPPPDVDSFPKSSKRSESAHSKSSYFSKSSSSRSAEVRKTVDVEKGVEEKESLYSGYERRNWKDDPVERAMSACLRYVSLIPGYEPASSHVATLTGAELLQILLGSPLDQTLLLASYFTYLGLRTYVLMGSGLPRGRGGYVLTQYDARAGRMARASDARGGRGRGRARGPGAGRGAAWLVFDAAAGEQHALRDFGCPVRTVDYVFDNENIWVNIQSSQDCEHVSFDFTRTSDWQQVFNKDIYLMKQPILSDASLYKATADVENLRSSLENRIKMKIQKWRSREKTIWNRYCSTLLREMLPQWEAWAQQPAAARPALSQRMKQFMVTYKVYGFALSVPFAGGGGVGGGRAARALRAALRGGPRGAELAAAVDVCAYPNDVLAVWLYVACVTRI